MNNKSTESRIYRLCAIACLCVLAALCGWKYYQRTYHGAEAHASVEYIWKGGRNADTMVYLYEVGDYGYLQSCSIPKDLWLHVGDTVVVTYSLKHPENSKAHWTRIIRKKWSAL